MSLFQKSVVKKHLNELDNTLLDTKYKEFQTYFGNREIQDNIRNSKEEQFQEGFLSALFVNIFGFTLNPQPNFNLTTEQKNITNSKKADGAILQGEDTVAVIELKSTNTTDLDSVETQAFGYKNHHPKCVYVITSNFEKLRFYIENAVDHIDFDLFDLSQEDFALMWLCLAKENLLNGIPKEIKDSSVVQEENISKKLYADYSKFRRDIFDNLVNKNPDTDKLLLFKKTQKLLDRFLFLLFAEDRLLVPANSVTQIIEKWEDDVAFGDSKPLYNIFKQYFNVLNTGRPRRGNREEIFAYNGGLFAPDEILDNISIDDDILFQHTRKLTQYDFETEVDVNILGHIFEHSLGEIENVQAEIKGEKVDSQKTRRKKDGIFYTPKYITKYIVENTVGRLCEEKRKELDIKPFLEFDRNKDGSLSKKAKDYYFLLEQYREWLLSLTILDPACGSGAFLNQTLDFLLSEHDFITVQMQNITGDSSKLFLDVEKHILEKNIYGVDLNEESVEIAKLSLWLRTAQKGRKLNKLNNNIKCGNSLIDDPEVAGEKAFNWEKEFPEIFDKGGFDVVIGNPPYVHLEKIKDISLALKNANYESYHSQGDLFVLFVEKGLSILKEKGLLSYIMPNKWLQAGYGRPLREFLLNYRLIRLIDFGDIQIFEGATTYPCIFISQKNTPADEIAISVLKESTSSGFKFNVAETSEKFKTSSFKGDTWVISSKNEQTFLEKLHKKHIRLSDFVKGQAFRGVLTGLTEAFIITEETKKILKSGDQKTSELIKPVLQGRDIMPWYSYQKSKSFLIATFPALNLDIDNYPTIKSYFLNFGKERLEQTGKNGSRKKTNNKWFETQDTISYHKEFAKPKIMYQKFQVKPCFIYDEQGLFCNDSMWIIPTENKALLGVLNSKMGWWLITKYCTQIQNGYQLIWKYFSQIPIPNLKESTLKEKVEKIISATKAYNLQKQNLLSMLSSKFDINSPSRKLKTWDEIEFKDFIKELTKKKIKLSLSEETEWMQYFNEQKEKAQLLKCEIEKTDNEIDQMVYELYGLTEDEIQIVEEAVK
ncbi:MAG: Eco57I restriction-modification methylase domain-containing protein [Bacteriovoracia bacterium]